MKIRAFGFAVVMGGAVALLAVSNINCSVLQALAGDGGGGVVAGGDGGAVDNDGGGVPGTNGSVAVTYNCMGDACGKTGTIVARVKACGAGGAVVKSETLAAQTLTMGTPIMMNIADVPAGSHCLRTYLDVNGNTMQDATDVIPATDEVMITVVAATPTAQTIDFTMVKP